MTYEFKCYNDHLSSLKFKSISEASQHFESDKNGDTWDSISCRTCCMESYRIYNSSGTLFYGDGWDKPSPSGRQFTKGPDPHKSISSMGPQLAK